MTDPSPWQIDDSEFHELESRDEQLRFLLQYAVLAPSSHNAQPWRFRITAEGIEVLPDLSRRLPLVDPLDRELWLSIGAAIANLRVAAAHFGFETTILFNGDATLVALRETCAPDGQLRELFPAIKKRHTNRKPFRDEPLDPEAVQHLCDFVDRHPDTLRLLLQRDQGRVADLVAYAEREQMSKPLFRQELANWIRPADATSCDGMTPEGLGLWTPFAGATEWLVRNVDVGALQASRDRTLIETAAALIVVAADDDRVALVNAGETLERLLLRITLDDLDYSFFNAAIEVASLRDRVWSLAGTTHPPQLLLRVGRARSEVGAMPRRPVDTVLA